MNPEARNLILEGISNNIHTLQKNPILKSQSEKLWSVMGELLLVTREILDTTDKDDLSEQDFAKLMILVNCFSDLAAVTQLLQGGFFRPSGMIFRGVVENVSLAVAINQKPEIYPLYKRGKYETTDAVNLAKDFITEIGKVNGLLSNFFVHEPHKSIGRGIRVSNNTTEIMLVPGVDQGGGTAYAVVVNILALSALMLGEALEWCLVKHLKTFYFWERVGDGHLKTKSNQLKSLAKAMAAELENLLKKEV